MLNPKFETGFSESPEQTRIGKQIGFLVLLQQRAQNGLPDPDYGPGLAASFSFNCSRLVVSLLLKANAGDLVF